MGRYSGYGSAAVGTDTTILTVFGGTSGRVKVFDVVVGSEATPADVATNFVLARFTAVGTEGSGFTPVPLDPADVACNADCGVGVFSAEPTYTAGAVLLSFSLNQRATFRYVCAPESEFIIPATANNGIGCKSTSSGGTAAHEVTMLFVE